jgi:hypothetical protein
MSTEVESVFKRKDPEHVCSMGSKMSGDDVMDGEYNK